MLDIRRERDSDIEDIYEINIKAFETQAEADLVNILRNSGVYHISLVAERNKRVLGHIFFTPVELAGGDSELKLMGLAPMAVLPEFQNQGIGSKLVKEGLRHCSGENNDAVFVLGHPDFYTKFGFLPSVKYGIKSDYDVPDETFMAIELKSGILDGKQGTIKYNKAFGTV